MSLVSLSFIWPSLIFIDILYISIKIAHLVSNNISSSSSLILVSCFFVSTGTIFCNDIKNDRASCLTLRSKIIFLCFCFKFMLFLLIIILASRLLFYSSIKGSKSSCLVHSDASSCLFEFNINWLLGVNSNFILICTCHFIWCECSCCCIVAIDGDHSIANGFHLFRGLFEHWFEFSLIDCLSLFFLFVNSGRHCFWFHDVLDDSLWSF